MCTITRFALRANYKQPPAAQSEVAFICCLRSFIPDIIVSIDTMVVTRQGCAPEVSVLVNGRNWLCTQVSNALLHLHNHKQIDEDLVVA